MSALMDALMGLLSGAGAVLDTPGSIVRNSLAGENPLKGLFDPEERTSGREMLQSWGVSGENDPDKWFEGGDIAGFGAELVTDPLNLLGLGLAGKAAKGAKSARLANEGITAQNAGMEAANAMSQAMRAQGALPEELLPQAQKFYDYKPDARTPFREVPGQLDDYGADGIPRSVDELNEYTEGFGPYEVSWPESRKLDYDYLTAIQGDVANLNKESGKKNLSNIYGKPYLTGKEGLEPLDTVNFETSRLAQLLKGMESSAKDADKFKYAAEDFKEQFKYLDTENSDMLKDLILSENMPTTPQDLLGEILKSPNDPLHGRLRATEEFREMGNEMIGDFQRSLAPTPEASQSFYALPNPKFIDRNIHQALTSDDFPATLLEQIENAIKQSGELPAGMKRVTEYLGDDTTSLLRSQVNSGRQIPQGNVFEGGQTFLPYIAPALRETTALQEVPKMPSRLLQALFAYNAAQTAGGY